MTISSMTAINVATYIYYKQENILAARPEGFPNPAYVVHPEDPEIYVIGVRYTLAVNAISKATISLGFRGKLNYNDTTSGIDKLQWIFPINEKGAELASQGFTCEVYVNGNPGSDYTTLDNDLYVFKGEVIGYSISSYTGQFSYDIECEGYLRNLQQVKIGTPGVHGDRPYTLRVSPISYHNFNIARTQANQDAGKVEPQDWNVLLSKIMQGTSNINDGFSLFLQIVENYEKILEDVQVGKIDEKVFQIYKESIKAFGFDTHKSPFESLKLFYYDKAQYELPNSNFRKNLTKAFGHKYLNNPYLTFWHLLLSTLEAFGLNIIDYGIGVIGVAKAPLYSTSDFIRINYIRKEDMIGMQSGDRPFMSLSRCVVTTKSLTDFHSNLKVDLYGQYPKIETATEEELTQLRRDEKNGPRIMFYKAPVFMANFINDGGKNYSIEKLKGHSVKINGRNQVSLDDPEVLKTVARYIVDRQEIADLYAKYTYMNEKFKSRVAQIVTRYMPNLIPGLPCTVEDPARATLFDCNILEVSHVLDSNNAQASTSVTVNNIRYAQDIKPYPFKNPFYQNFSLADVEDRIAKDIGFFNDPWYKWNLATDNKYKRGSILDTPENP